MNQEPTLYRVRAQAPKIHIKGNGRFDSSQPSFSFLPFTAFTLILFQSRKSGIPLFYQIIPNSSIKMFSSTIITLLSAGFAIAAPIYPRDVTLDPAAVAEAQVRDNTATRAFSAAQIQTSSGQCLAVDPASGDFRENLIPIQVVACNGSDTQQWDIITSGVHNNEPGFALVVSTLTNGCLNFDPRRAAGNQVLLFSCGGRADGSGAVTNSQLFTFTGGAGPLPLVPQNGNNGTCLTVNENLLDQTSCDPVNASGNELFTISASGSQPATASNPSSTATETPSSVASSSSVAVSSGVEAAATSSTASAPASTGTTVLDPAAVAQAQVRDDTATRAFSAAEIQTSDGQCLSVDANSGDFRENLIPITVQACDGSSGQQWDVITSGVHNNVNGTALIVSTLTQGCLNFDPRRAAGNQVILFSCGGRADGSGNVTTSQLFTFTGASSSIPLVPTNQANTCLFDNNGNLDVNSCDTANPDSSELFTFSTSATSAVSSSPSSSAPSTSTIVTSTSVAPSSAEAIASASSIASVSSAASTTVSAPASTGTTVLDPAAVAQAQVRDDTATRAFSAAEIQTSDRQCLSVDANSGDFRENLIPITVQACDGSAGQQWDVITSGVHNNVNGTALIVSTLTQGCLNFDPRRAAGNQVILFSCGGRADGSGNVTNSQLFTFTGASSSIPLVPTNQANTCLFDNNGNLDVTSCDTTNPNSSELFSISASGASVVSSSPATATPSISAIVSSASAAPSSVEIIASASSIASASTTASTIVSAPASTGTTVLDPASVAQAQVRDDTATRAFSAAEIQTSDGQCLSVDATSGDFRENLIPITTQTCDGSAGQQWDVITAGVHNNVPGTALFVSTLIQGCLNFDPRRAAGNQVILFSCGGRADGSGAVTTAQLFTFTGNSTTIPLLPANQADTCLFDNNGNLDDTSCDTTNPEADQMFTIVP